MRIVKEIKPNKKEENKKLRVAAYARVSLDTEMLKHSLSNQISYYNKLIQSNKNYVFAGIYADEGISGGSIKNRTKFNELIDECRKGNIDLILTKSVSRFARNTVDLLNIVRELKEKGIGIIFEKENVNTLLEEGELMLTILAGFAQHEAESISTNVKWGIKKRLEKGHVQHRDLFGYIYKDGKYELVDKEAKVVKKVFDLFLNGKTYTEIANIINKGTVKTRSGRQFNQLSIKDILRQEKYAGYTISGKRYVISPLTHKAVRNKGEQAMYRVENTHPAIIPINDFDKVQEKIKKISEEWTKVHKRSK